MPDNKIDSIFKKKIDEIDQLPANIAWDKENSWLRLEKKRKQKKLSRIYYYAAAILILGFLLGQVFNFDNTQKEVKNSVENTMTEYEKRQKLAEIERKMSGDSIIYKICYACDEIYYQVNKNDRPLQFRYFDIN